MKLTESKLRKLIREELLKEVGYPRAKKYSDADFYDHKSKNRSDSDIQLKFPDVYKFTVKMASGIFDYDMRFKVYSTKPWKKGDAIKFQKFLIGPKGGPKDVGFKEFTSSALKGKDIEGWKMYFITWIIDYEARDRFKPKDQQYAGKNKVGKYKRNKGYLH